MVGPGIETVRPTPRAVVESLSQFDLSLMRKYTNNHKQKESQRHITSHLHPDYGLSWLNYCLESQGIPQFLRRPVSNDVSDPRHFVGSEIARRRRSEVPPKADADSVPITEPMEPTAAEEE